jgi:ABC-2 type transport system ATP-binding protein
MGCSILCLMDKAVIVDKLTKNFQITQRQKGFLASVNSLIKPQKKTIRALRGISFSIEQGELVGFIGPNGAGKTTTLKVLSGLLYPTSGFTQVLGFDPWERKAMFLKQISLLMGQKNQLWWDLPAIDTFELNRAIYEIPQREYKANLDELVAILEVGRLLKTQVRRLSLGQRMRLELVAALLHKPKVMFLDEPTIGLDVIAQARVREFIGDYNRRNQSTIILTSHNMDDVADLAKRVIVIDKWEILFDGELRELVMGFAKKKLIKVFLLKETDFKQFEKIGKVKKIAMPEVVLSVPRETAAIAAAEILQNFPVADLDIEEEPLEDVIRRVFKGGKIVKSKKIEK